MKQFSLILLFLIQCSNNGYNQSFKEINSETINTYHNKGVNYIYQYVTTSDSSYLDSALITINDGLDYCNNSNCPLVIRKLNILSILHRYKEAISFIEQIDSNVLNNYMGEFYYKSIFYRFLAMDASYNKNIELKNDYLDKAIKVVSEFIENNNSNLSNFFSSDKNELFKGKYWLALAQYQYYYYLRHGNIESSQLMNKLKEQYPIYNKIIIFNNDFLNLNLMEFTGI